MSRTTTTTESSGAPGRPRGEQEHTVAGQATGTPRRGLASLLASIPASAKALAARLPPPRLASRSTGERDQARIRVAIGVLIFVYAAVLVGLPAVEEHTELPGLAIPLSFLVYAVVVFLWCIRRPSPTAARRIIALVGDIGALSYILAVSGPLGAPWYPIYLWVIFGNAIRYGLRYLYAGMASSAIGFSAALHFSSFWQDNLTLGLGLLAGVCVLPIYVAKLLQSLNAALVRAEEANRAKTRFLANMSHELRTPLNGVIAVGDMLAETQLSSEQRDMARTIQTSAHALLTVIDQVLDISKIETGRLEHHQQRFDLYELIRGTAEIVRPHAASKGLALEVFVDSALPCTVVGYPVHLRQVLLNLVGNATKFTQRGRVALRVSRGRVPGKAIRAHFEISDTGIGIPVEARSRIFEPFAQADESVTRHYGGTGLGTTIARQLVELLGGQIEFDSQVGFGTTFRFEIELVVDGGEPARDALAGMRILAVGFGDVDLAELRQRCQGWGVTVSPVDDLADLDASARSDAIVVNARERTGTDPAARVRRGGAQYSSAAPLIGVGDLSGGHEAFAEAGYMTAISDVGDETCLFRALHLVRSRDAVDTPEPTGGQLEVPRRILLAEDNLTNRKVAQMILEDAGHRVDLVEDGRAALSLLEAKSYDLAILDMHMPGMGGVDAAQLYRVAHPESAMPFILLTADATTTAAQMSEEAGIDAFLTKPIRPSTLRAAVLELTKEDSLPAERSHAAAMQEVPAPPSALINRATLDELAAMNARREGFLDDLVQIFLSDAESRIREMRRAIASRDWDQLAREAHRLGGAAGSIGAEALSDRCIAVSRLGPDALPHDAPGLLDSVSDEYQRARSALDAYLLEGTELLQDRRKLQRRTG